MTICTLIKGRRAAIVLADDRLSRDEIEVSFDKAEKLTVFTPRYLYPVISNGRFER